VTAWLLTWLWQGLALTLAVSVAFRMVPRLNAATRYGIWWLTVAALGSLGLWGVSGAAHVPAVAQSAKVGPTHLFVIAAAPDPWIAIVVGVWIAIALVSLVRVVPGIHAVFQLRDRCTAFPRDVEAQLPLWLASQARGRVRRPARLMLCEAVRGATVLGFYRPYIALPPSLLMALTRDELDQIVLHEYAHVRRRDDWTRLAQTLFQSVLWIHPATALIGRRLDLEREMACDECVVARTGQPKAYARCLARAADVRGRIRMEPLLGPALFTRRHDLVHRVNRLLAVRGRRRSDVSVLGTFAGACALVIVAVQLRAIPLVGEFAEIAPGVAVRLIAFAPTPLFELRRGLAGALGAKADEATAVKKPGMTQVTAEARTVPDEPPNLTNPRTNEPANQRTDEPTTLVNLSNSQPDVPDEPNEPLSLSGRSFDGQYIVAELPAAAPENRAPWQVAGAIGAEIGASARRTSVRIANAFTRAGVSLARTF
jgi:beta-lactamase regulating signal transducer with metallopeptidase domain